ncbi:MAG TPA: ABC transporter substrate-binding protein [Chloroflexota bacterium]|nr:ABC transporter substrate-binding protein [Chloroflexota bacterium]
MKLLRVRLARLLVPLVLVSAACAPTAAPTAAPAAPTAAPAPPAAANTVAPTSVAAPKPAATTAPAPAAATTAPAVGAAITPGPVATKPATNPTDKIHIVFGGAVTPPNMVHLAPYLAKDMGFFDEVGLDVEIKSFEGGVAALRGGMSGGLDVVATSSDPLFAAVQQGAPVKAIGTYAPKLSVVLMAVPDVKAAADLKGKKLGIQGVGGFADVMSRLVLAGAGISPNDVQFIDVATANRVTSMANGQTDAAVLHVDQYYTAQAVNPNFNVLARMWEVVPDWWYSAFVATDDVRTQKREAMVRFMTAVIKAQRFMYTNPVETKKVAVDNTKEKPEVIDKAYDDLAKGGVWSVNDGMPQKLIDYTITKEVEVGTIKADNKPTYESIVDKTIVNEAIMRNGGPWTGDPRWY